MIVAHFKQQVTHLSLGQRHPLPKQDLHWVGGDNGLLHIQCFSEFQERAVLVSQPSKSCPQPCALESMMIAKLDVARVRLQETCGNVQRLAEEAGCLSRLDLA